MRMVRNLGADRAGAAAAALSAGAILSRRPSGLDADVWRWLTGAPVSRQWIDFAAIAPALPRSVVASEDAKFCSHHGIDWDALQEVIEDAEDGEVGRGGSTITQQMAKNLFLWPGRSFVRKALEFPLAIWIDLVLPKQRMLEIYLNIAEWGPTASSAPRPGRDYAFGRSAASLSPRRRR